MNTLLREARDAYARRRWGEAYRSYRSAAEYGELDVEDLTALADAAWWLGRTTNA